MSRIYEALTKAELSVELILAIGGTSVLLQDVLARCRHKQWRSDQDLETFSNSSVDHPLPGQFRNLQTRLQELSCKHSPKILSITSSIPAEGKTFITGNLAQAIVRVPDLSVLIIDADLRCGRLHDLLGAPSSPGLTEYLNGAVDEMGVMQHGRKDKLFLIPRGEPVTNPSELLSNGRLKTLLERVGDAFDWILLDCPPCLPFADVSVIAEFSDSVLLVARAGSTSSLLVEKACRELKPRNLIGIVLNAFGDHSQVKNGTKKAVSASNF